MGLLLRLLLRQGLLARLFGLARGLGLALGFLLTLGLGLCIGLALTGTVVGEFITANEGLGFLISHASGSYALNVVWVALFTLMVLSTVLNIGVGALEKAMLKHRAATQPGA